MNVKWIVLFFFNISIIWAQVGIGTTNPQEELEVQGSVRIVDGNQGQDKTLVSDTNGTGSWQNINDGVKTRIIRSIGNVDPTLWSHPRGIDVPFNTGDEIITVTNNTGDSVHNWNIVIEGDSRTASGSNGFDRYIKNFRKDGESISIDLGDVNSGWFRIIASRQDLKKRGFIMNIVYYGQDFNGMVQYWDEN